MNSRDRFIIVIILLLGISYLAVTFLWTLDRDESVGQPATSTTYNLVSIDGLQLPCSPMHEGGRVPEIAGGSLTVRSNGTFSGTLRFSNPNIVVPGGDGKNPGTYTREGNTLIMEHPGAGYTQATIEGDTLTMYNEGMLFVYQR